MANIRSWPKTDIRGNPSYELKRILRHVADPNEEEYGIYDENQIF